MDLVVVNHRPAHDVGYADSRKRINRSGAHTASTTMSSHRAERIRAVLLGLLN
jgi:hypothetical protein